MKTILSFLIFLPYIILSQDVTVSISSDKPVYIASPGKENQSDLIRMKCTLHNNTSDTILIKFEPYFELEYVPKEYSGYSSCFDIQQTVVDKEKGVTNPFKFDDYSSFVKIPPKDSLTKEGEFDIFWPCRGMPPRGNWDLNVKYKRVLTSDDNFFLFNSRYTDLKSKEFVKAWEGEISSNIINIKIMR